MDSHDSIKIQKQIRDESEAFRHTIMDLQDWEHDIKLKEKELKAVKKNCENKAPIRNQLKKNLKNRDHIKETCKEHIPMEELWKLANEQKEKGNSAVKDKDYENALQFYTKAIEIYDNDPIFYSNRSLCYSKMEKYEECIMDCSKALLLDSSKTSKFFKKVIFRRMQSYFSIQRYRESLSDCRQLIEIVNEKNENEKYKVYFQNLIKAIDLEKKNSINTENLEEIDFIVKPPHLRSKKSTVRIPISELNTNLEDPNQFGNSDIMNHYEDIPDHIVDKLFNSTTGESTSKNSNHDSYNNLLETMSSSSSHSLNINKPSNITAKMFHKENSNEIANKRHVSELSKTILNDNRRAATDEKIDDKNNTDDLDLNIPEIPKVGSQFHIAWRELSKKKRYLYLKSIPTSDLKRIIDTTLDSELLTEILYILKEYFIKNEMPVQKILLELGNCQEMGILSMLLSTEDRDNMKKLIHYMNKNKIEENELELIKMRFQI